MSIKMSAARPPWQQTMKQPLSSSLLKSQPPLLTRLPSLADRHPTTLPTHQLFDSHVNNRIQSAARSLIHPAMASAPPPPFPFPSHISHNSSTAVLLSPSPASSRSIPLLGPIVLLFIVFLCFLSFFLFRDFLHIGHALIRGGILAARRPALPPTHGLDPAILATFPTLPYSLVKGLQEGKCGAECAVCLGEFAGGDIIRLLTVCCHAFHPPCIDSWLAAHATCPVCRSDLQAPPDEAAVMAVREAVGGESDAGESHAIDIDGKGEAEARSERLGPARGEEARVTGVEHDRV